MASQDTAAASADDRPAPDRRVTMEEPVMEGGTGEALRSKTDSGHLPPPKHAITAPATTGRLNRAQTNSATGGMRKGRSTYIGFKPDPEDLLSLRERRYMSGLFHLNSRLDVLDAGHHLARHDTKPGEEDRPDPNLVVYDGPDDPYNPQNWTLFTKCYQTLLLGICTMVVTVASSIFSTATQTIAEVFGVSAEVATLSTSCFLLGYTVGPSVWGPASEVLGRRVPLIFSYFGFAIFQIPCAVAQNLQTVMLGRFCAGLFASGTLAIVAGTYSDYWSAEARGAAIAIYAGAATAGPALGPVIGNFVTQSYLGWRWTAWVTCFWAFLMLFLMVVSLKESFTPILLQQKAKKLRFETKNWALRSKLDETQLNAHDILLVYMARPLIMFFVEPILFIVVLYASFVYAILYLLFGSVAYIFEETRGEIPGTAGLVFFAVFVGAVIGVLIVIAFGPRYNRKLHEQKRVACPEERCLPMALGTITFAGGFFVVGWTSVEYVSSPWGQIVGIGMVGNGFLLIFLSTINLVIDCYLRMANSAVATHTIVRSLMAAGFPLFGVIMYRNLGVQWASTLLVVFAPFPFFFYFYCDKLLEKSKYAPKPPKPAAADDKEKGPDANADGEEKPAENGNAAEDQADVLSPVAEAESDEDSPVSADDVNEKEPDLTDPTDVKHAELPPPIVHEPALSGPAATPAKTETGTVEQ